MKKYLLILLVLSSSLLALKAQSWLWARQGKNASNQGWLTGATSIAMDKYHNVYQTGKYDGDTVIFGSDTLFGQPFETFLVKYDENGNVLWAKSSQTNKNNFSQVVVSQSVITDSRGNAYITGEFEDTINFQSFSLECPKKNFARVFLVKYDANGNVKWARQSNTMDTEFAAATGFSITTDKSDNIYITGSYDSSAYFGSDILRGTFYPNVFLVKYDSNGNVIWAKQGINGISGSSEGQSVITDNKGYIYITGIYGDSITFGSQTLTNPILTQNNLFIVKFDSNGNVIWAKQPMLHLGSSSAYGDALGKDNSGNIYVTGYFYDTVSFGSYTLINPLSYTHNNSNIFWAKYDNAGNVLWAKQAYNQDTLLLQGWSITTDDKYNLYFTGIGGGAGTQNAKIIFDSDTLQSKVKGGAVWLKFDSSGTVLNNYIFPSGGNGPKDPTVVDSSGCYVYFGGTTFDTVAVFGSDTIGTFFSAFRPFVARWSDGKCTDGINIIENPNLNINLYPNPTNQKLNLQFDRQISGLATLSIMDITGREVLNEQLTIPIAIGNTSQLTVDVSSLSSGMYFIQLKNNDTYVTQKFIKL